MITVTNLRKIFTEQGVKGAGKWKREDFTSATIAAEFAAYAEAETRKPVEVKPVAKATAKKAGCEDCGRKVTKAIHPTLCPVCFDYAGWENTHSDSGHAVDSRAPKDEIAQCPICHPELDKRSERRAGVSRVGQEIVAKGTEVHKSLLFKREAEAAGWTVSIQTETYEEGNTRTYATATKGQESLSLAWEDRAYDYRASSAVLAGKDRKVRNLKEALRFL